MAADPVTTGGKQPAAERRALWRLARRQVVYLAATLAAVSLLALLLSTAASAVQALREEGRTVDIVLVVAPAVPEPAVVDHAFELYRRGFAPQLVIVGAGAEGLRAALQERGVADTSLAVVAEPGSETAQLRRAAAGARAAGAASAVVAGEPAAMLRWLKLAGDEGLRSYGAPFPVGDPSPLELVQAGASYWRYILLRD